MKNESELIGRSNFTTVPCVAHTLSEVVDGLEEEFDEVAGSVDRAAESR